VATEDPQPPPADPAEPTAQQPATVCVLFKGRRIEALVNPDGVPAEPGALVLVEAERGVDLGEVIAVPPNCQHARRDSKPRRVLRLATPEELELRSRLREEEAAALVVVKERVARFGLPMHLVDAEYQFDRNRVTFYFTADHRVDFRELVRDLAAIFRTRIELRQIGTREASRRLGGMGPCGRELCCCSFLWDFERVTLQMAREQNLAISPSRLSGICGRLLCCLTYEEGSARASEEDGWCGGDGEGPEALATGEARSRAGRGGNGRERNGARGDRGDRGERGASGFPGLA